MNTDEKERQALIQALVAELSASAEPLHLDYELIEAYVDGRCDAIDQEIVSSHASMCPMCGREVRDLQTFAAQQRRRQRRNWLPLAAAAIAAVLILAILPLIRPSTTVLALHDGSREVRLTRDGQLSGISGLTINDERRIANALRSGMVAVPPAATLLAQSGEALRSTYPGASSFEPLAPIGCIIVTDRPTFEWTSVPEARYRVEVFSDHFRPVAESGVLDTTRWTVPRPLPRGATYVWQVTAIRDAHETTSPAPPAPEARFAVLDEANAQAIARLELVQPRSHLALGVAYASAGVTAEAERELQELASENQNSADAQRLLQSLRSH